ncbi:hypothetical protein D3C78_1900130 [compost metagenome]
MTWIASAQQMVNRNTGKTLVSKSMGTRNSAIRPRVQMVQNRILNSGSTTPSGLRKKKTSREVTSRNTIGNSIARS